ncbi:MAG: MFS transporter [Proteobacteria bacterium]|nr:MAG: MFS transporter [Pseudomonadota bacterium]
MFKAILRVASGNFLEMYDFMVFAYFAPEISRAYFPSDSPVGSLLLTFATFGAGYLMRPLGAVLLGSYFDHHGRRDGLLLTLGLMSVGTLTIAIMPTYATIGLAAPLLVLAGRLVQGFSAGAELGGVSVYLAEIAPAGRKGFFTSWQSASQQVAVIFASLIGALLSRNLSASTMDDWGWRIPLGIGCLIVPFLFWIRAGLEETAHFKARTEKHGFRAIWGSLAKNWRIVLIGAALSMMSSVCFYFITAYTPTYGRQELQLGAYYSLIASLVVGASNLFWLPISGALSDRIGRRPILLLFSLLAAVSAYPALLWLSSAPSYSRLIIVELWLSLLYAFYNGTLICYLTEIMPAHIRTTGFSLAYSLAVCAGGFTPFFCTWLIQQTGNVATPGLWLTVAATLGFLATLASLRLKPLV